MLTDEKSNGIQALQQELCRQYGFPPSFGSEVSKIFGFAELHNTIARKLPDQWAEKDVTNAAALKGLNLAVDARSKELDDFLQRKTGATLAQLVSDFAALLEDAKERRKDVARFFSVDPASPTTECERQRKFVIKALMMLHKTHIGHLPTVDQPPPLESEEPCLTDRLASRSFVSFLRELFQIRGCSTDWLAGIEMAALEARGECEAEEQQQLGPIDKSESGDRLVAVQSFLGQADNRKGVAGTVAPPADDNWRALRQREEEIAQHLSRGTQPAAKKLRTRTIMVPQETNITREMVMEWWQAVTELFNAYQLRLHRFGTGKGPPPPPFSMDLTNRLRNLFGELAAGNIPDPVRAVTRRGNPSPGPAELTCIRMAVAYVIACKKQGLKVGQDTIIHIKEPAPIPRICGWFGVKRTTVQGWVKKYPPADFGDEPPRKTSCDEGEDPSSSVEASGLIYRVKEAGRNFQSVSRSGKAIHERAAKRTKKKKAKVRSSPRVRG